MKILKISISNSELGRQEGYVITFSMEMVGHAAAGTFPRFR
jgi:hypothetical protein